jgi:hypothetical protein
MSLCVFTRTRDGVSMRRRQEQEAARVNSYKSKRGKHKEEQRVSVSNNKQNLEEM